MFVRKKKNISGVVSVQIIDKSFGKYRVVKTIGCSSNPQEIAELYLQGKRWISEQKGERDMFLEHARRGEEKSVIEGFLNNIENILLNGTQLILNPVYHNIGFDRIDDDILRHLVISRICIYRVKGGFQSKKASVTCFWNMPDEEKKNL